MLAAASSAVVAAAALLGAVAAWAMAGRAVLASVAMAMQLPTWAPSSEQEEEEEGMMAPDLSGDHNDGRTVNLRGCSDNKQDGWQMA
mmetsp:Transcript_16283/g.28453  ORF Transcript_16283/g.28453 Transcript_16283/m.28453 type:complete len:87 (+) Transcript_16283:780-1040(+)